MQTPKIHRERNFHRSILYKIKANKLRLPILSPQITFCTIKCPTKKIKMQITKWAKYDIKCTKGFFFHEYMKDLCKQ